MDANSTAQTLPRSSTAEKTQLFRTWFPIVLRWCAHKGGTKVDPQDAAQDVCIIAFRKLHTLEDPTKLRAWLFSITRGVLKDHRGRAWNRRWSASTPPELCDEAFDPEECYAQAEAKAAVQSIIRGLPKRQREVVSLCLIERRSMSEVSQLLQVPQGTVASRLRLARKKIERAARIQHLALC